MLPNLFNLKAIPASCFPVSIQRERGARDAAVKGGQFQTETLPGRRMQSQGLEVLVPEHPLQDIDILGKGAVDLRQFLDLADRVHDRRVVAPTELAADLGE